jgi:hypothetical protein
MGELVVEGDKRIMAALAPAIVADVHWGIFARQVDVGQVRVSVPP